MTSRKNNRPYFRWLCKRVYRRSEYNYRWLLQLLNNREFYWSVPNDDDRLKDGLTLREIYADTHPSFLPVDRSEPCSILEVLIALADRIEYILADDAKGDRTAKWFWMMIKNLGLEQFHDSSFDDQRTHTTINYILTQFVNRTYDRQGHGSLFPSKKPDKNLARVEIWYQMMAYLDENYAE